MDWVCADLPMHSLSPLFCPRSVALVGASADERTFRGRLSAALISHHGPVKLYFVSRSQRKIHGIRCYGSVSDVPERVDLVIPAIPAAAVPSLLEECGEKGARAVLIVSSGFADEQTDTGRALQQEVQRICAKYRIALLGPNCQGFLNTHLPLAATFSAAVADGKEHKQEFSDRRAGIALVSQSGGLGFGLYSRARERGARFSYVIAAGNQAGIGTSDIVDFVIDDPNTHTIIMILERLDEQNRLPQIMERAAVKNKCVFVLKAGRSDRGIRAAQSHTGALVGSYEAYRSLFRRYGLQEAANVSELIDKAVCHASLSDLLPAGKRVAILTPSGGAGIILVDICEAAGLEMSQLDDPTRQRLREILPPYASTSNPVDITAQGVIDTGYVRPLAVLAESQATDSVIVVLASYSADFIAQDMELLHQLRQSTGKPIVFCSYTRPHPDVVSLITNAGFPFVSELAHAASALAAMHEHREWLERAAFEATETQVPQAIECPDAGVEWPARQGALCEYEVKDMLRRLGLHETPGEMVDNAEDAVRFFHTAGKPVAMKIQSPSIPHKTEVGGVRLNLDSADAVRNAFDYLMVGNRRAYGNAEIHGVLVEPMAEQGLELIIGASDSREIGPLISIGIGGILVELLDDIQFEVLPVNRADALKMLKRLKGWRLLQGFRGSDESDVPALLGLVTGLAGFVESNARLIQELDLNPVFVHKRDKGVTIGDAFLVVKSRETNAEHSGIDSTHD